MQTTDRVARRIKLRDLRILLAVAKAGGIGRASADLAISQPAVSKVIADLESELGVRLFDRGPHGVQQTIYGEAILKTAVAIFDDLRLGVKTIEFLSDPTSGQLRIGTTPPLAAGFVPTVIGELSRKYSRFIFDLVQADQFALHQGLHDRTIDLAIAPSTGLRSQED